MANKVGELIKAVAFRLGNPGMKDPLTHGFILDSMRSVYNDLNPEYNSIEKLWEIDFGSLGANDNLGDNDGYFQLPDDWIRPYRIDNPDAESFVSLTYVPPEKYNSTVRNTYTINLGRIYFASVDTQSAFDVFYHSSGSTLVDKEDADVQAGEANTPEYPAYLQRILLYGTCLEISNDYPMVKPDIRKFEMMKQRLGEYITLKQLQTPLQTNGVLDQRPYPKYHRPWDRYGECGVPRI